MQLFERVTTPRVCLLHNTLQETKSEPSCKADGNEAFAAFMQFLSVIAFHT